MTFLQLWEHDEAASDPDACVLPLGLTRAEVLAADRAAAGEKLGPNARRSLRRFDKKLAAQGRDYAREDWDRHDEQLRAGARTGPSSGTAAGRQASPRPSARPDGAASLSAPSRATTARPAVEPVGGGGLALRRSAFDARGASPQDYQARLRQLGVSTAGWYEEHTNPRPPAPSLGIQIKAQKIAREAAERQAARAKELEAGRLDARTADPAAVRERLTALGIEHDLQAAVREIPKPLDRNWQGNPVTQGGGGAIVAEAPPRAKAVDAAARRVRHMLKSGERIDARRLAEDQLAALYKARGLDAPGGTWGPATRAPPRR